MTRLKNIKWLLLTTFFLYGQAVQAQTATCPQPEQSDTVLDVYTTLINGQKDSTVKIGSTLTLHLSCMTILDKSTSARKPIILYINSYPLQGVHPISIDRSKKVLIFQIANNDSNLKVWSILYKGSHSGSYKGQVTAGLEDGTTLPVKKGWLTLQFYSESVAIWKWVGVVIWVLIFILLCWKTNILRGNSTLPDKNKMKYSLSQAQLAWWTFIFMGSYLYLYLVIRQIPNITDTCLVLLGISAATTVGASIVGGVQNKNTAPANSDVSKDFLTDVLSDDTGLSIHRLQNFIFTIILGLVFIIYVSNNLQFPEWSNNVYILLGISSGTYVGLKATENKLNTTPVTPPSQASAAPPPPPGTGY